MRSLAQFVRDMLTSLSVVSAGVLPDDGDRYIVGPDPRLGPLRDEFTLTLVLDLDRFHHPKGAA